MGDPMRVVITGAAGRLGTTVASLFHAEGFDVVATDTAQPADVDYRFEVADLRQHEQASSVLTGARVVIHLGNHPGIGNTPPQVVFNENVTMNENVFQGAVEHGVEMVVFASTIQLIGSKPDLRTVVSPPALPRFPVDGMTAPVPANVYALSKEVGEVMLRYYADRCGLCTVALRLPLLHHEEGHFSVDSGNESHDDIFEGFTGLTYADAARLMLALVHTDLSGHHVLAAGTAHRHIEYSVSELIERFYPDVHPNIDDLINLDAVQSLTGWCPSPGQWRNPAYIVEQQGS